MKTISEIIKQLREDNNLTSKDLVYLAGHQSIHLQQA